MWRKGNPKIKRSILCHDYENEGLKNVDMFQK